MDFRTMMALDAHGDDTFVGLGPHYPWGGGVYGGQIVAQALRAAAATVEPELHVHSLHAYFIRRGDQDAPIRYEVDRSRDGRSFSTRRVVARQAQGEILTLAGSFQRVEAGPEVQVARLPGVPGPGGLAGESWSPMFERRFAGPRGGTEGRSTAWLRMVDEVGDDPVLQACALAYLSDDLPMDAVIALHPDRPSGSVSDEAFDAAFMSASLDHAVWFHRPLDAGRWHLHEFTSHGYRSSRGVSIGHVLAEDGAHAATIAQEVLLRAR